MADLAVFYDPTKAPGERLGPSVRTEIALVAPAAVLNGSITTAKLADDSVTEAKVVDASVTTGKIADLNVTTGKIAAEAVTTDKVADDAITPAKTATGVVTALDSDGNYVEAKIVFVTAAQYAALSPPDPNSVYYVSA